MELTNLVGDVNAFLVFFAGLLSFFSPCVVPLIPIYLAYLSGNTYSFENGVESFDRKKVMLHTLFFILGISVAFFLLGISLVTVAQFLLKNKSLISKIAGGLIILFGLFQLDIFKSNKLSQNYKIEANIDKKVNPLVAFVLGFTFSFAWTPCVGPMLSSVLILASSAESQAYGNFLIFIYSIGFLLPFILLGLFTSSVLNFLKKRRNFMQYTKKIGGIILILMGIITFTGFSVNALAAPSPKKQAANFELMDNYGKKHKLSDYKGKVVVLNFWSTNCKYCVEELPELEEIYKERGFNQKDVVILGVTNPSSKENPYAADVSKEELAKFVLNKKVTYPILFDMTADQFFNFQVRAFPTTAFINKNGEIEGIVSGALSKSRMNQAIDLVLTK